MPVDVIGEPETERKVGTDIPTEVTLLPPLPPILISLTSVTCVILLTTLLAAREEIIGFCGVPVIETFSPAVSALMMFDANIRPDPALMSVLLVSMPPSACRRPFSTEEPDTRNAPLMSVLLVSMPPSACRRPFSTEDPETRNTPLIVAEPPILTLLLSTEEPDTRNAPLIVAEVFIPRRAVLGAICVLFILFTKGRIEFVVLFTVSDFESVPTSEGEVDAGDVSALRNKVIV